MGWDTGTPSSRPQTSPCRWEKMGTVLAFENCKSARELVWLMGWKILGVKIQIRIIAPESGVQFYLNYAPRAL